MRSLINNLIIIFVILGSWQICTANGTTIGNGRNYENQMYKYKLIYPANWVLREQNDVTLISNIRAVREQDDASVLQIKGITGVVDHRLCEQEKLQRLYSYVHSHSSVPWQPVEFNGMKGYHHSYSLNGGEVEYYYLINQDFVLELTTVKKPFADGINQINSILKSVGGWDFPWPW